MKNFAKLAMALVVAIGGLAAMAAPASAGGLEIHVACGEVHWMAVVNGNGDWAPARDTKSTLVFHPTAFGDFFGTFTPTEGEPIDEYEAPFALSNPPRNGRTLVENCEYSFEFAVPGGTFVGKGTADGWFSGTRNN